MEYNMMAGYGDYNWSVILWLFIGVMIFIVVVSLIVRKVTKNRSAYRPGKNIEDDVIKERKTRNELSKEDSDEQQWDSLR